MSALSWGTRQRRGTSRAPCAGGFHYPTCVASSAARLAAEESLVSQLSDERQPFRRRPRLAVSSLATSFSHRAPGLSSAYPWRVVGIPQDSTPRSRPPDVYAT